MLNCLPWKWTEIILLFLRLYLSTAFQTLVDYEGYTISFMGFLPIAVDIIIIWIEFAHCTHFSSLIPKMLMFSHFLPDSIQFTLIRGTNNQNSYAILVLIALDLLSSPDASTTEVWPSSFILPGVIRNCPLLFLVAYWTPSNLGDSCFCIISFCLFIQSMGFSWEEYWGGLPFPPSMGHFVRTLHYDLSTLGGPAQNG